MPLRILLAGFLGAVAMFVWTAVAHMATPLGSAGFSQIPGEATPAAALQTAIGDKPGLYLFPWTDPKNRDAAAAYAAKAKTMPTGFLVYRPAGDGIAMTGGTLGSEFLKQLLCCLAAATLLALAVQSLTAYAARAAFVAAIGVAAALTTNGSYAIWYGFPTRFTLAAMTTDFLSYVFAGLVMAALIRPPRFFTR
jgi:hypothetical protein